MTSRFFLVLILFLGFGSCLLAQNDPYTSLWKKTDSLIEKKGLTESALAEINKIYTLAKKEKNDAQLVKALIYKISLKERKDEDVAVYNIRELDKEIGESRQPSTSILLSIEAEAYWNYFQRHRSKLYGRTATNQFKKEDISTWGIDDFHKKIGALYLASISEESALQQTKLDLFTPIIIKGNVRYLRPTLYDLLAHRALDYFKNDERDVNKPAFAFELDDPAIFEDKTAFSIYHFMTKDSLSVHFKALLLFQQLLQFHLHDPKPDALLDADIERIQFALQYGVMDDKEELYMNALKHITDQYGSIPPAAQAWYLQAQQYANRASQYRPLTDTANRYSYLQAKAICERVVNSSETGHDSSEGKSNCAILLITILRKELRLQTEKVNIPGQPFRSLVSYRNVSKINYRIIKLDRRTKENLNDSKWKDNYWKQITQLPILKTFDLILPDTKDYQLHSAEIKLDSLPPGEYALLASEDAQFNLEKNLLAAQFFYISNLAYIQNGNDYFVLNRETGQPLQNTDVQVWYRYYDVSQNKYLQRKGEEFNTNKDGFFHLSPSRIKNDNSFRLELTGASDHLFMDDEDSYYEDNGNEGDFHSDKKNYEADYLKTFLFTDRSIYRPGQTVYFKGITVTKDFENKQYKIVPQFKAKLILYDANSQKLDSLPLVTNEFGSYQGKFKLPSNLLNGEFAIEDDSTHIRQAFSVEEYKRPKFYVEYDTLKDEYRVLDKIKITGGAKAYAGNAIDGAIVRYRVIRQTDFPHPWLFKTYIWPTAAPQEIAHGEIKTNKDGKFSIEFMAMPDKLYKKEMDPVFNYRVIADVTDINGETRSAESVVHVGYKSMNISITLPSEDNLSADSLKYIFVKTENLSGHFEPAKVNISIYPLLSPNHLIRERLWVQPDQFIMSRGEYWRYFPNDEYSDETKKENWEKLDRVFELSDITGNDKKVSLGSKKFKAGWYVIEATAKDKYGEEVRDKQYVQLYGSKTGRPASPQYNWATNNSQVVEPGNAATATVGSSANDVFVIQQGPNHSGRSQRADAEEYHFINLSNEKKSTPINITESDRGGIGISYAFVKNNRFYASNSTIRVPWTNKELNISYETYRDKTLPGSEEKWKIKITGYKKDKVAAEILSSMYDASLDQFKPHSWNYPDIFPTYISEINWNGQNNFSFVQSEEKYWSDQINSFFIKNYDRIIPFNNYQIIHIRGMASVANGAPGAVTQVNVRGYEALGRNDKAATIVANDLFLPATITKNEEKPFQPEKSYQPEVQIRKNFNETAFFLPDLKTDSAGNMEFSFAMPEALTQWKWMLFAHTKDLSMAYSEKTIITQKQLMVQPNAPRFFREGDRIELSTKIVNMTDSEFTGQVHLQLIDPLTNQPVDSRFSNKMSNQHFTIAARQSTSINFPIEIPFQYNQPVTYRITATIPPLHLWRGAGGEVSDGEESTLPVLSNQMLVTESLPINIKGNGTKNFRFEKLIHSSESETLKHQSLTVEFSGNPAWYAVQALPYLIEYPYECSEQNFNRFYANALASMISNSSPRIKEIFDRWKNSDTAALLSNLQKNEELKSVLLQETPWVLEAKNESAQKKNIALLFDMVKMNEALESSLGKLQNMQLSNGGFSWFKDGPDDRYITQYILTGIGHLKKLNALPPSLSSKINSITSAAITYLDKKLKDDYEELKKENKKLPLQGGLGNIQVHYLYMRSFFSDYPITGDVFPAVNYYRKQSQQSWVQQSRYMQGMIALSLFRTGDGQTAKDILASLKQNATTDEENGMYWKDIRSGYYWYEAPVETQSLLIEAFQEISRDNKIVGAMKTWLLKQKQTQNWKTTKATADACYALLREGSDWLAENREVEIKLGDKVIHAKNETQEAGTGYFKKMVTGELVKPDMGNISVSVSSSGTESQPAWGSVYWQYFENLDKITLPAGTKAPLTLIKKIFIEKNTDRGPVLEPVMDNGVLKVGDKIKVRIELHVDRDMEYVHMKDMRASCTEPVNVLSEYKWQGGLGYYESTKDASTDFFFSWLPEGTHVFEYPLFVMASGNFSNGITTIQCMYAPEFSSHSEGIRITVGSQ